MHPMVTFIDSHWPEYKIKKKKKLITETKFGLPKDMSTP